MQKRKFKKKKQQLEMDRGTEIRLNELSSTTRQNEGGQSPPTKLEKEGNFMINIPKPKRAQKPFSKENQFNIMDIAKIKISNIFHGVGINNEAQIKKQQLEEGKQLASLYLKQIASKDQKKNGSDGKKQYRTVKKDQLGQILSFYLGESEINKGQRLEQPMKTVYDWQNEEIKRFVSDPNIGDYIIKLPNPDNLSDEYIKLYPDAGKEDNKCEVTFNNALQFYKDMFDIETTNKRRSEIEKKAFMVAYFLLGLEDCRKEAKNDLIEMSAGQHHTVDDYFKLIDNEIAIFKVVLRYYIQIESLTLDEFRLVRKMLMDNLFEAFKIYQQMITKKGAQRISKDSDRPESLKCLATSESLKIVSKLNMQKLAEEQDRKFLKEKDFADHKFQIRDKFLTAYLKEIFIQIQGTSDQKPINHSQLGYDNNSIDDSIIQKAKGKYHCLTLLKSLEKISNIFTYFVDPIGKELLKFIEAELDHNKHRNNQNDLKDRNNRSDRKLFKGKNLEKVILGDNLMWVNNKNRPKDLFTLLRNCLIYQLTQKCLLRTRAFLTKNQNYIMLVIKVSEEVLEYYAQENEIAMEVEIGATDIFSFEPVDKYQRPLRVNSYIRDEEFIKKYSLRQSKLDKDGETDLKSTQSQALNMYKKAEKMNPDELRAKIILDQQETDQCYRWVREKLGIKFIDDPNILNNQKNSHVIDRQTWQCYYIYNKLVASFIKRLMKTLNAKSLNLQNDHYLQEINKNIGFMLRLILIKALSMANGFFYIHRESRSIIPNFIENTYISKRKLKTIWDLLDIRQPTGYTQYVKNESLERIWRKYEINERKNRSKFFPAERLNICHKIISKFINIDRSIEKQHITSFYPLHDPFILKGIKIDPYLLNLKQKIESTQENSHVQTAQTTTFNMYTLYESKQTASDFTKLSVEEKLGMEHSLFKHFSVETVRFYCGQKIAFYFEFMRYVVKGTFPYIIFTFIIQIFLWVEQSQILSYGQTYIGYFNDILIFIMTLLNMFWTTNAVENWKFQEKNLAEKFGVAKMTQKDEKIVRFVGKYRRNFETDDMNFQYVPKWITILKSIFTFVINMLYLTLVSLVLILIFVLKSVLFVQGYSQNTVNVVPSLLISIAVQLFNFLYTYLIGLITQFQNHKTISSFERSLISKSYVITFVITFISIFIYAFFSKFLDGDFMCTIKTTATKQVIENCSYFVSSQLLSLVIVDFIFTIIGSVRPYAMFKWKEWRESKKERPKTKFYFNKFESIDEFYEEEDKMQSNMFNQIVDNSWMGYMNVINIFTALSMFGPALPFVYALTFISTLVRLHASKYQLVYLAKRSIPVKTNSINYWLTVIQIVSVVSIITNIAYLIYTRKIFSSNQTQIFFFFILAFLLLKFYLLMQYNDKLDVMGERNKRKVTEVFLKKSKERFSTTGQALNTDILNVYYNEASLERNAPKIKKANVRFKDYKKSKPKTSQYLAQ